MSARGLLILVALLVVVVAWVLWTGHDTGPGEPDVTVPLLDGFVAERVVALEVASASSSLRVERSSPGVWRMTVPVAAEADRRRVEVLLERLAAASIERAVTDERSSLAAFGLDRAALVVTVRDVEDRSAELRLGSRPPIGEGRYAVVDTGPVVLVSDALASALELDPQSLRERRLVPIEPEAIRRISVSRPGHRLTLERDGSDWTLTEPLVDRGDFGSCDALARAVASLSIRELDASKPPARAFETVLAVTADSRDRSGLRFEIGAPAGPGRRWIRRGDGSLAGKVLETAALDFKREADELRERRLAFFSNSAVREVRVTGEAGERVLRREGGGTGWRAAPGGEPVHAERVTSLLDRIRYLRASGFSVDPPGREIAREIVVLGDAGELGRLRFGTASSREGETIPVWSSWRPSFGFEVAAEAVPGWNEAAEPSGAPSSEGESS